jgi:hypothetical protein
MSNDPKSYERLERETDTAWAAFQLFKSLGSTRTIADAQEQYAIAKRSKTAQPRRSFHTQFAKWRRENDWDARVAEFDADQEKIFRERLREEDHSKFIAGVTQLRDTIEAQARLLLQNGLLATDVSKNGMLRLNAEVKRLPTGATMTKQQSEQLLCLRRSDQATAAILTEATNVLERAYGIRNFIDQALENG